MTPENHTPDDPMSDKRLERVLQIANRLKELDSATASRPISLRRYDELLLPIAETTPHVAKALTIAHMRRVNELDRYINDDTLSQFFSGSYLSGLNEVFLILDSLADHFQRSTPLTGIAFLLKRARAVRRPRMNPRSDAHRWRTDKGLCAYPADSEAHSWS